MPFKVIYIRKKKLELISKSKRLKLALRKLDLITTSRIIMHLKYVQYLKM